jgi:hypothetical protein
MNILRRLIYRKKYGIFTVNILTQQVLDLKSEDVPISESGNLGDTQAISIESKRR